MESTVEQLDELSVSTTTIGEYELLKLDLRLFPAVCSMTHQLVHVIEIRLECRGTQLRNSFQMANQAYGHSVSVSVISRTEWVVLKALSEVTVRGSKRRTNGIWSLDVF